MTKTVLVWLATIALGALPATASEIIDIPGMDLGAAPWGMSGSVLQNAVLNRPVQSAPYGGAAFKFFQPTFEPGLIQPLVESDGGWNWNESVTLVPADGLQLAALEPESQQLLGAAMLKLGIADTRKLAPMLDLNGLRQLQLTQPGVPVIELPKFSR